MPIIKSAKKRVRVAKKAAIRNSKTKRSLKGALKAFHRTVTGGDKKKTATSQSKAQSALDKATKKGVIHKNKAARQKKQLAAKAKAAAGAAKAAPAKKAEAPKKVATKKTVVKKAVAKKAPAKKPAAKKK
jgi:small subunit ribosomal protein S20